MKHRKPMDWMNRNVVIPAKGLDYADFLVRMPIVLLNGTNKQ